MSPAGPLAGALTAAALVVAYVTLLRFDLTLVPLALGTMMAARGHRPRRCSGRFPARCRARSLAAVLAALLAYWWLEGVKILPPASASR